MRERDIEDLIAAFPEEFFPGHSLALKGRQQSFAGIGRFDLLFTDQYKTNVLVELKAVTAKYENATQLAKYKDALEAQGERNILMWLVAPNIPSSVREFLDRIGIEYSEIHEVHLRRVAERHGITIESTRPDPSPPQARGNARRYERKEVDEMPLAGYRLLPNIDRQKLADLILDFEAAAKRSIDKSLAVKLREQVIDASVPSLNQTTILQLARWCKTENPLYWDGMAVAQKISTTLFGLVLDRKQLGT
jgi:hypothetical protein